MSDAAQKTTARSAAEEALLDAAERLLVEVGYAGITTRRLAEEAGVNHGLVHYYFGSNEKLLVRALERFTERLIDAAARAVRGRRALRREVADGDALPRERGRRPTRRSGSSCRRSRWNNPGLRERLARVNAEWRAVLTEAFDEPHRELGIEMPLDALVSLVMTFNIGMIVERLGGIETGHDELLEWIDAMAVELSAQPPTSRRGRATRTSPATSSATASSSTTRSTARASRPSCSCRRGRSSTRATGRCRSRTSPGTAAWSRSTGAATAAPTGRGAAAYHEREFAADALAVMDATATERAVHRRRSRWARSAALLLAASHPERVEALVFIAPAVPLAPSRSRAPRPTRSDEQLDTDEGWAKYNRHYWLARLRGLPRVLLLADVHRAALDEADRGLRRLGAGDDAETLVATQLARRLRTRRRCASSWRRVRCPVLVIHGSGRRDPPVRAGDRARRG